MKPNRWDILIILLVLFGACLVFSFQTANERGERVFVDYHGTQYAVLSLFEDTRMDIDHRLTVVIQNGCVHVEDAVCDDLLCEKHVPISRGGESIVCLPSQIAVTIEGKADVDAIAE